MVESPSDLGTIFTTVSTDQRELWLRADCFSAPIDLARLQTHYPRSSVLGDDPLVLRAGDGNAYVVVLRFGAVVFWRCTNAVCANILHEIGQAFHLDPPRSEARDALVIRVDQAEERVTCRDIALQHLTLEHIRIVSETFGQATALRQCELSIRHELQSTTPIVHALQARGKLRPSRKSILRTVGSILAVRDAILARLSLFDGPAETWQRHGLGRLPNLLSEHFGLRKRLAGLHEQLAFLSDLNLTLMGLLQNRTSHRLEWTLILLIAIQVVLLFVQR